MAAVASATFHAFNWKELPARRAMMACINSNCFVST
jgi:hypothetical protein